jgi:hypothetical protein
MYIIPTERFIRKPDRRGRSVPYHSSSMPFTIFRGYSIWGLTFRVLTLFSDVLDAPLPHLEETPGLV